MLYIISLKFTHFIAKSLYSLASIFPFLMPSIPSNYQSFFSLLLWIYESALSFSLLWDSAYKWDNTLFVFLWFISLSIIFSMLLQMEFFHSFYGWVIFHCIYEPHLIFIHLSVDGHLGCFCMLATVKLLWISGCVYLFRFFWINT